MQKNIAYTLETIIGLFVVLIILPGALNFGHTQIDPANLNKKLLEHEIKTLVDSTRLAHNLPPLYNDSILYVAAGHHANYLVSKGMLSHNEPEKKEFYAPQDRANYYGAPKSYLVGENVVYAGYNASVRAKGRTFNTSSYKEMARCLVYSWIKSKGHFENIINPDYQVTALAIGVDPEKKRIYACQKFAHVVYTYSFEENTDFFPYSNISPDSVNALLAKVSMDASYPFGLRFDEKENCDECKDAWEYYPAMSVRIKRKYFILRVENAKFVKELIKNRRDGFAIELVPFDAFACGNPAYETEPSRRNEMKRTSGRVLEPVYRNDLLKGFKKRKRKKNMSFVKYLFTADSVSFFKRFGRYKLVNFDAKYFEIKLGKIPKDMNSWWNHNLMYIHDKQICHFVYLTNYPGELDMEMIEVPYYPPVPVNNYEIQLEHFRDTLELFYAAGETHTSGKALDALIAKYKEKNLRIKSVDIEGLCSVEGRIETNERLHRERAANILSEVETLMDSDTVLRIHSHVAWEHFYASVKDHPKWKFLFPMSRKEIMNYLTDPKNERPTEILKEERKVKVEITGVRDLNPKNANYYVKRDLKNMFTKDRRGKVQCINPDSLRRLYEKAFYFTTVDTLSVEDFLEINIPQFEGGMSHELQHDIAFYRYHYLKDGVGRADLGRLEAKVESVFAMCGAAEHLTPEFHYLSARLLVQKIGQNRRNSSTKDPNIQKAFNRLNLLLNWYEQDSSFMLNVSKANLNIVNILCETIDPDQIFEYNETINTSLIHIMEYYRKTNQLNSTRALSLAKLFCYFKNIPLAIDLCQDFLDDDEVLKLYLPLAYNHSSYLSSDAELAFEVEFQDLLMEARQRLSAEEWCKLFYGNYGIPFQVMDNKALHTEFCATCPNRVNEMLEEIIR